ncbi:MAG: MutS-related protein [Isosphaeraceae bacterium]
MGESGEQSSDGAASIRQVYDRRLGERSRALERWTRWDRRVADIRLAVFVAGLIAGYVVYQSGGLGVWWLAIIGGVFLALVVSHEPISRAADRARRAVAFYSKGLARLDGKWAGTGVEGLDYLDLEHPYAADLDLFGRGSMFERLCTARTRAGEAVLASWLLAPAMPDEIDERHEAIDELRPRLDLREDLELLGAEVRAGIDPAALAAWCVVPRVFHGWALPVVAAILACLATASLVGWLFFEVPALPLLIVLTVEGVLSLVLARRVRTVLADVDRRTHDLVLLSELLSRLESEPFGTPLLQRLAETLRTEGLPASTRIRRLARLLHLLETRQNQFFMPIAAIWLWTAQIAMRIDAWRGTVGSDVALWIEAIGKFEALCALGAYAAENPQDPFAEIADATGYEAEALGHPLIPARDCVRNDITLGPVARVLIVSGSNMSGKSTLLRTVGINAVLALAGAPVRARRLRLCRLALGATLRIQDSLQAGRSRFYAEITRVRQLVEQSRGPLPLLFLFDELFHGTNSHDRCVGAESVLKGLVDRGAIGLLTTHDLTLARIADRLSPLVMNVHFEDQLVDGKMLFDYRMRPGVVEHSNALALMRAIGLEV